MSLWGTMRWFTLGAGSPGRESFWVAGLGKLLEGLLKALPSELYLLFWLLLVRYAEKPGLVPTIVIIFVEELIALLWFWWFFRGLLKELTDIARTKNSPALKLFEEYLDRRQTAGSTIV
ncbi:hypothetical protein BDQ17DRAFT_1407097 [Cyathus striatus]|nr:hypothetical protein BDQ17DRAFT_1407097 [Cyathus striatus]